MRYRLFDPKVKRKEAPKIKKLKRLHKKKKNGHRLSKDEKLEMTAILEEVKVKRKKIKEDKIKLGGITDSFIDHKKIGGGTGEKPKDDPKDGLGKPKGNPGKPKGKFGGML